MLVAICKVIFFKDFKGVAQIFLSILLIEAGSHSHFRSLVCNVFPSVGSLQNGLFVIRDKLKFPPNLPCHRHLVIPFNLEHHILQLWEIFLKYFASDFLPFVLLFLELIVLTS